MHKWEQLMSVLSRSINAVQFRSLILFLFLTTTTIANAWQHNNNTSSQKEVATQRQTLIHADRGADLC